jgi:ABC-type nitrate/sulfonate/bicarbonate transport system substrate-binding protein
LVKLPYVLVTRPEIKRPEDLRGKSLGIVLIGDLSDRLSRATVTRMGLPPQSVTIRPIGGSQGERYQAMAAGIVQGVIITPPLDVRAKKEGFNVLYRLIDLNLPFIYSSLHTSYKMLRERPDLVQRMVAAFAEIVHFVEKNPDKAKASMGKAMRTKDPRHYSQHITYMRAKSWIVRWWFPGKLSPTLWSSFAKGAVPLGENRKKSMKIALCRTSKRAGS